MAHNRSVQHWFLCSMKICRWRKSTWKTMRNPTIFVVFQKWGNMHACTNLRYKVLLLSLVKLLLNKISSFKKSADPWETKHWFASFTALWRHNWLEDWGTSQQSTPIVKHLLLFYKNKRVLQYSWKAQLIYKLSHMHSFMVDTLFKAHRAKMFLI